MFAAIEEVRVGDIYIYSFILFSWKQTVFGNLGLIMFEKIICTCPLRLAKRNNICCIMAFVHYFIVTQLIHFYFYSSNSDWAKFYSRAECGIKCEFNSSATRRVTFSQRLAPACVVPLLNSSSALDLKIESTSRHLLVSHILFGGILPLLCILCFFNLIMRLCFYKRSTFISANVVPNQNFHFYLFDY